MLFIIVFVIIKILTTKQEPSAKELFNLINASPQSFIKQNATAAKLSTEELSLNGIIRTKITDTDRNIYNVDTTGKQPIFISFVVICSILKIKLKDL